MPNHKHIANLLKNDQPKNSKKYQAQLRQIPDAFITLEFSNQHRKMLVIPDNTNFPEKIMNAANSNHITATNANNCDSPTLLRENEDCFVAVNPSAEALDHIITTQYKLYDCHNNYNHSVISNESKLDEILNTNCDFPEPNIWGVGAGIGAGALVLVGGIFGCWYKNRHASQPAQQPALAEPLVASQNFI